MNLKNLKTFMLSAALTIVAAVCMTMTYATPAQARMQTWHNCALYTVSVSHVVQGTMLICDEGSIWMPA